MGCNEEVNYVNVVVKLFANLREDNEKEQTVELKEGSTVLDIVDKLKIPMDNIAIIMINGRRQTANIEVFHNDVVSLFPPVGGG